MNGFLEKQSYIFILYINISYFKQKNDELNRKDIIIH